MNAKTKHDLQEFITAVENLGHAVSSVAGLTSLQELYNTAEQLKVQLDKDETILDFRTPEDLRMMCPPPPSDTSATP